MAGDEKKRVVILGGGFGGVHTARSLDRMRRAIPGLSVTLINAENYFVMTPLLFEAGSGVLEPRHAVIPIRLMFDEARFVQGKAEHVDLEKRSVKVRLPRGEVREFEFDHVVFALGGVTNTSLIPGSESGRTFKTLYDAITLRNHCIQVFENADVETDETRQRELLTFVIVGGGLVGLELQGELTEFIKSIRPTYRTINPDRIRMELIEGGPRLVPELDADLGEYAAKVLTRRGVNVRLNTRVERMEKTSLRLTDGEEIRSQTIVLATGVAPNPLIAELPLAKGHRGRIAVDATMRCQSHPFVWALGDCAAIPDAEGKPYPPLAQHALREARVLGRNIAAAMNGTALQPFVYRSKGTLAALGRYKGVGRVYKFRIHGFIAWWVWRTYYLMQMPRTDRKLRLIIDWTVSLFFRNDVVELDMTDRR